MLAAEAISTVLDLRSAAETERRPAVLAGKAGYRVAPLVDPRMDHLRDPAQENSLLDLYRGSIDRNGRTIVEAIRHIIQAPEGGVLVHCAAGKDRTGILIAIILALLGTPPEVISEDYALTEARLAPHFAAELAAIADPVVRERVASRQHSTTETMNGLLSHLDEKHGGAANYLLGNGLTDTEIAHLTTRLTG